MKQLTKRQKNNYIIIGIIVILLVIIALVLLTRENSSIKQNFNIDKSKSITRIVLEDREGNKSDIKQNKDSIWMVNNSFEASSQMIKVMLKTLRDMRVREPVSKAAKENIIKQLAARNTRIDIYVKSYAINLGFIKLFEKEKLEKSIFVGDQTMDNMGTYMLLKGTDNPCIIHIPNFRGYLSSRFTANPYDWKSHTIFNYKPQDIETITVSIPNMPEEDFEIFSDSITFHFKLTKTGEVLKDFDTIKVTAFISSFMNLNYEDVAKNVPLLQRDTIFAKAPNFIFKVKDKKGGVKTLKTYSKFNEGSWVREEDNSNFYEIFDVNRMYGLVSGVKDTLILQYFALDNILKPASYYLPPTESATDL